MELDPTKVADLVCPQCFQHSVRRRQEWPDGPWQQEPDFATWEHLGLPCIAHRGGAGAWCGYVAVPPGHPAHGKDYGDEIFDALYVHGGLTYADKCHRHICHVPKPGEPDDVWWLGFDCAHAGDMIIRHVESFDFGLPFEDHYWTLAEVQEETNCLAEQLKGMLPQR